MTPLAEFPLVISKSYQKLPRVHQPKDFMK